MSKFRINRRHFVAGTSAAVVSASSISRALAQMPALKVGVLLPTSGAQAGIGQDCNRGVDIGLGILKDLGYPNLQIINGDTETLSLIHI